MNRRVAWWAAVGLAAGLVGCDSGGGGGEADAGGEAASALALGLSLQLAVIAPRVGGGTRDVTAEAAWASGDPAVLAVAAGEVTAVAEGAAEITARFGGQTAAVTITVGPAAVMRVSITPEAPALRPGGEQQFRATAHSTDGGERDVTAEAEWTSSDPATLAIDAAGKAAVAFAGAVTLRATYDGVTGELAVEIPCDYPRTLGQVQLGMPMPPVAWTTAYGPDGQQLDFRLKDVHCGARYRDKKILVFVIGAAWCGSCTAYVRRLANEAAALDAAGVQIRVGPGRGQPGARQRPAGRIGEFRRRRVLHLARAGADESVRLPTGQRPLPPHVGSPLRSRGVA